MKTSSFTLAAALTGSAAAYHCTNLTIPVEVSARNGVFNVKAPQNNIEVTEFILNDAQQGANYTAAVLTGYATVKGKYNLAATYCVPGNAKRDAPSSYGRHGGWWENGQWHKGEAQQGHGQGQAAPKELQILTHGIGFDRSYWDVPYHAPNYSYSAVATDNYGFATLSYDRLGIGMSSHGDPVNEIQAALEIDALRALTVLLRAGSVPGIPKFDKYYHVGHSFGSVQTYALTAAYPSLSDGIALTGFTSTGAFLVDFLYGGNFVDVKTNPTLAPLYSHGYLAAGDASGVQTNFFSPYTFDAGILAFAAATGQPVTVGELLSIGGAAASPNAFTKKVLVITGERDVPFCGGSCYNGAPAGSSYVAQTQKVFTATTIKAVVVPGAGHGLNLEYSHPFTFNTVNQFFAN